MDFKSSYEYDKDLFAANDQSEKEIKDKLGYQFVPVAFKKIYDPEWRKNNRCALACNLYMRTQVVRKPYSGDKYDLFNRYYKDNKYACGTSLRDIALAFGYRKNDLSMAQKWIKKLFKEGAFEIETIEVPGKPKPANIYILGYNLHGKQIWYYDN